ncbi:MAG: glucosidase [Chlamydiota bacterium]
MQSKEQKRIAEKSEGTISLWHQWGPYVSERSWGTVREDYSWNGDAWNYFPYDLAHSKVYRWGDDAIAGWCDRYQTLIFAPVFWNGKDPLLKERLFGLSSSQGNHGEDVKEYYFHLDGTPTHSYMKYLYKYSQDEFPYAKLKEENRKRGTKESEYELVDTGVFSENQYFDIFIEYAKVSQGDCCIRIEAFNRGNKSAPLHIFPHLWFRNQWAWGDERLPAPSIADASDTEVCLMADDARLASPPNLLFDYHLGKRYLYGPKGGALLFTDNEDGGPARKYSKDGFHRAVIYKEKTTNPEKVGTKACLHYTYEIPAHESVVLYLRFSDAPLEHPLADVEKTVIQRREEADEFYETVYPKGASLEEKRVFRQALAGMLWNKQIYLFDVNLWLQGDNTYKTPPPSRYQIRNIHWKHLNSMRVLSMPDKWEYPWFAAWDLAFHCITIALIDVQFAKEQLWFMLFDQFQHPNGAIPSYEWEFSDLNPPVQAWAAYRLYEMEKQQTGKADTEFLNKCFLKLLMNFAWWVNKVDSSGNNVFEGGFLGLDNITLIDRSKKFMEGATIQQSDGTGWMAMFCLNLMRIALELAKTTPSYESLATKFFQHFVYIAHAIKNMGQKGFGLWSEQDHFFYDALSLPNGEITQFRVRSIVGIIPLFAVEIIEEEELLRFPEFASNFNWFLHNRQTITKDCVNPINRKDKKGYLLSLVKQDYLGDVLKYVWDPKEFRSPYGLRSLSKIHENNPFIYQDRQVGYEPNESFERVKGGNSNWRGPIWMAPTFLLVESLKKFSLGLGEDFTISIEGEEPVNLHAMAVSFSQRVVSLFTPNSTGARPFYGEEFPLAKDPFWRDYLLFYEYYNPETGKGIGASHQTGWSGLVANFIYESKVN